MKISPFKFGDAVRGNDFFGKSRLELSDKLATEAFRGNNTILYGPSRLGKTSILLKAQETLSPYGKTNYIDGLLIYNSQTLKDEISSEFEGSIKQSAEDYSLFEYLFKLDEELSSNKLYVLFDEASVFFFGPQNDFNEFTDYTNQLKNIRFLLIFHPEVMQELTNTSFESVKEYKVFELLPYSLEETREFLSGRGKGVLKFSEESIQLIYQITNGNPSLIQQIGERSFYKHSNEIDKGHIPEVSTDEIKEHLIHISDYL